MAWTPSGSSYQQMSAVVVTNVGIKPRYIRKLRLPIPDRSIDAARPPGAAHITPGFGGRAPNNRTCRGDGSTAGAAVMSRNPTCDRCVSMRGADGVTRKARSVNTTSVVRLRCQRRASTSSGANRETASHSDEKNWCETPRRCHGCLTITGWERLVKGNQQGTC